jgi:hypothetical protein
MSDGDGVKRNQQTELRNRAPCFGNFLEFLEVIVEWSPQKRRKCAGDTECDHVGIG